MARKFNCLVVKSRMKDKGHPQFEVENVVVLDEVDTIQNRKKSKLSLIDISEMHVCLLPSLQTGHGSQENHSAGFVS